MKNKIAKWSCLVLIILTAFAFLAGCGADLKHLDIDITNNNTQMTITLTPKRNISDLEITIEFLNSNKVIIHTESVTFGDVRKDVPSERIIRFSSLPANVRTDFQSYNYYVSSGTLSKNTV
ncbi:MAG: hypothetical protein FWH03_03025 [Firmicutes bacterium]|nr:hypothetical protein [Bacillota bacterium]